MAARKLVALLFLHAILVALVADAQSLSLDFYKTMCPEAGSIVKEVTTRYVKWVPSLAGGLLRIQFHDCFARVHGPKRPVALGRRDGKVSKASETSNLPSPFAGIEGLKQNFAAQGPNTKDLRVLSDHVVMNRLYNFSSESDVDRTLNHKYAGSLRRRYKPNGPNWLLSLDWGSTSEFDAHYYHNVAFRKGLFVGK